MRGVFITGLTDIEDSSLVVIIHGVGILVQPRLVWVHWWGWSIALLMDHMVGLDIIRWLNVVGMSHMVSCVMTKVNTVMQRSRAAMDTVMNGSRNSMDSMMNRGMDYMVKRSVDCMMNRGMDCMVERSVDCMMNWSVDCMVDMGRDGMVNSCMMNRGRDGMDGVDRGGGNGLIVHGGGGASVERGVNYWHCMSRWGHHCMGLLSYVLVDRGWLGFCYIRTGLRMMDVVMDRWLTGIFCRGRMGISVTISMMGGGGVVAVLGVVDSGLYGGGMASLYHLVADLETLDLGQLSQQEEMHTD